MPTAKKLPSGSWRCQVFSHSEPICDPRGTPVIDPKTGRQKQKRFTNLSLAMILQHMANEKQKRSPPNLQREKIMPKDRENYTFNDALTKYIERTRSRALSSCERPKI